MKSSIWSAARTLVLLLGAGLIPLNAQVRVNSPQNNSQIASPVHYVASATSPHCSKGITDMRIYLAPHVAAYNVNSSAIDTNLQLTPGTYKTTVQAFDACGGVSKTPVNFTVTAAGLKPVRFLYLADTNFWRLFGFKMNPATGAPTATPRASISYPPGTGPNALASDAGGYRLYVSAEGLHAYFINRANGNLTEAPGSPVMVPAGVGQLAVHPSGKFVFVASGGGILVFRVTSDGSLKPAANSTLFPVQGGLRNIIVDRSGKYLYALSEDANSIDAFEIDTDSGDLTPLPGSPYIMRKPFAACNQYPFGCDTTDIADDYGRFVYVTEVFGGAVQGYGISRTTGTLSNLPGSPFPGEAPLSLYAEPTGRFLYVLTVFSGISQYAINAGDGTLTHVRDIPVAASPYRLRGDPSGKFLYVRANGTFGDSLGGYSIDPVSGNLTALPGSPFTIGTNVIFFEFVLTP